MPSAAMRPFVKREQLAWALVGLFDLLALVVLGVGFAHVAGYAIVFTWQLILGITVATLGMTVMLLLLIIRRRP